MRLRDRDEGRGGVAQDSGPKSTLAECTRAGLKSARNMYPWLASFRTGLRAQGVRSPAPDPAADGMRGRGRAGGPTPVAGIARCRGGVRQRMRGAGGPSGAVVAAFALVFSAEVYGSQYLICSLLILLLIGLRDDIIPLNARVKLFAQLLAAAILVFKSGFILDSFHGLFGVEELSKPLAFGFSLLL